MLQPGFIYSFSFHFHFQIFDLLPVRTVSGIPYETEDSEPCLHVRQKRYILPIPPTDETNDANSVFEVNSVSFFQQCVVYSRKSKL